jgi:hypothetical protein
MVRVVRLQHDHSTLSETDLRALPHGNPPVCAHLDEVALVVGFVGAEWE